VNHCFRKRARVFPSKAECSDSSDRNFFSLISPVRRESNTKLVSFRDVSQEVHDLS